MMRSSLCAVLVAAFLTSANSIEPAETVPIWPGLAPGETTQKTGDKLPPRATDKPTITRVENITSPTLAIYPVADPQRASGVGVLILPGGGFGKVVPDLEGSEAAAWLNDLGNRCLCAQLSNDDRSGRGSHWRSVAASGTGFTAGHALDPGQCG